MNKLLKTMLLAAMCLILAGSLSLFGCKEAAEVTEEAAEEVEERK